MNSGFLTTIRILTIPEEFNIFSNRVHIYFMCVLSAYSFVIYTAKIKHTDNKNSSLFGVRLEIQ